MKKEWWTAKDIAGEKLPGMPTSKRNVNLKIEKLGWNKTELCRRARGHGAPFEYHYTLLPDAAQAVLVERYADAPKAEKKPQKRSAIEARPPNKTAWDWFESLPDKRKEVAKYRIQVLARLDIVSSRDGTAEAIRKVAKEEDVSEQSIRNWVAARKRANKNDALPALAPAPRGGGGRAVDVDLNFWDAFRADYLRSAERSLKECYRQTCDIAKAQGWKIPNERTLRRRVDDIPEAVKVMARKGRDAVKAMYPAQERDRSGFHAMQAVNVDGHKWDVFCRYPDGTVARPLMVAFQDLYSGMFVAWRFARSENKDDVRLCLGDMIETYGIPDDCYLDNGRAFASKWLTGGTPNRYRFKVKDEEPDGILTQLGVRIHWTTPFAGQSKPIERGFRDFAQNIAKHPAFEGAYTGNAPDAKPENYGTHAVPIDEFTRIVNQEITKHNARPGRDTRVCQGKFSFQDVFDASYKVSPIRMATQEQLRMCMLMAESVKPRRRDGSIHLFDNRYWHEALLEHRGRPLMVRFDPEDMHQDVAVHAQDGTLICVAQLVEAVGFADTKAAREHAQARNAWRRAIREQLAAEKKMSLAELVALQPKAEAYEPPETKVIRPIFHGNLAMKPALQVEAEEDDFDMNFAKGLRLVRSEAKDF